MTRMAAKHERKMGVCAAALVLAGACGDSSGEAEEKDANMDSAMTDASAGDAAARDAGDAASDASRPADSAVTSDGSSDGSIDAAGSDASDAGNSTQDAEPDTAGLTAGGDFAATRVTGAYLPGTADEIRPVSGFAFTDPLDITKVNVLKVMLTDFPVTTCRVDMLDNWKEESVDKHILLCTVDPTWSPPLPGFYFDGNTYGWHARASWECYMNLQDAGDVSGRVTGDFRLEKRGDQMMEFTFNVVSCGRYDSQFF